MQAYGNSTSRSKRIRANLPTECPACMSAYDWRLIDLYYHEGLSQRTIGEILGKGQTTISSLQKVAEERLLAHLTHDCAGRVHELKTHQRFYQAIEDGTKPFEIRRDDRGFQVGDLLYLRETDDGANYYTGRTMYKRVTYIVRDFAGLKTGFVVMGLGPA